MLQINDLTYRIGDRLLFDRAYCQLQAGQKAALVGRNGTGKSTLLSMIVGRLSPESGDILIHPRASVSLVAQETPSGPRSLLDTVLDAHQEMRALEREAATATEADRIAEIHTRLADIDAHKAHARAAAILSGLGFDEAAQQRPLDEYSGGWRMRVALARALFMQPDLLLLDEPTNYLDLEGVIWLENFLRDYPYTVLIVSHDRSLLNTAVGTILHLEGGKLNAYTGGYDDFERARAERIEQLSAMKSKQEAERRRIQAFVDRFRAQANKASQAQSRLKMLERMQPIASVIEDKTIPFAFPKPEPLSPPLIAVQDAAVGYEPGAPVLKSLNLRIDPDDRIALLGANGNGKSTFAKLLSRRLKPMEGKVSAPRSLKIGYFAQHQLDELKPKETPFQHLLMLEPEQTEVRLRTKLGAFGFSADKADRPVETLSGGEKARLLFALMSRAAPQIMILDEPTNHLDVDSREALMQAINEFDGAVILISHDRHLVEACADRLWIVENGGVHPYDGDMDDYRRHLLRSRSDRAEKTGDRQPDKRKQERQAAARARATRTPLQDRLRRAESKLEKLTAEKARIDAALHTPGLYDGSIAGAPAKIAHLQKESARLEDAIFAAEEDWLAAQTALESAERA